MRLLPSLCGRAYAVSFSTTHMDARFFRTLSSLREAAALIGWRTTTTTTGVCIQCEDALLPGPGTPKCAMWAGRGGGFFSYSWSGARLLCVFPRANWPMWRVCSFFFFSLFDDRGLLVGMRERAFIYNGFF